MSQIDKVIFVPLLIWFGLFMFIIYMFIFTYFLGFFFRTLKIRKLFFMELLKYALYVFYFAEIFIIAFDTYFVSKFFNSNYIVNKFTMLKIKNTNNILN